MGVHANFSNYHFWSNGVHSTDSFGSFFLINICRNRTKISILGQGGDEAGPLGCGKLSRVHMEMGVHATFSNYIFWSNDVHSTDSFGSFFITNICRNITKILIRG